MSDVQTYNLEARTTRGKQWLEFAAKVAEHIDNYTVPQYGDSPDDLIQTIPWQTCVGSMQRYCARAGRNARPGQDKRDMMKLAHYAQIVHDKFNDEDINDE